MAQDQFLNEIKDKVIRKLLSELYQSIRSNNIEALHIVLKRNINVDKTSIVKIITKKELEKNKKINQYKKFTLTIKKS